MSTPIPVPRRTLPDGLRRYIRAVVVLGVACGVWAAWFAPTAPVGAFGVALVLLSLLTSSSTIPVPGTSVFLNADTPFLLALLAMGCTREVILLTGTNQVLSLVMSAGAYWRKNPHAMPFNGGAGLIAGTAGVLGQLAFAPLPAPLPVVAGALATFVATSALVGGAVWFASGKAPDQEWRESLLVTGIGYMASASIAILLTWMGQALTTAAVVWMVGLLPLPLGVWALYRNYSGRLGERIERVREREQLFLPTLEALVAAIEARDERTHGHNRRVRSYALGLARELGITDETRLTAIGYGALLHDVGKIAIPDALLHAKRKLTPEELERVRRHVDIGADLIRHVPFPAGVIDVVRHHHERWDGTGYPAKLAGDQIPLAARIMAVCEAYDDQRTGGGWREPVDHDTALDGIASESGTAFEPRVAEAFVRWQRAKPLLDADGRQWTAADDAIRASSLEQAQLHDLAFLDELTKIGNGRALKRDLEALCAEGRSIGVLMMDLDGFKGINDHFGHDVGDEALRIVGKVLAELETADRRCYRNGGDEFIVVLPGAFGEDVMRHSEEVRVALECRRVYLSHREFIPIRVSVGGVARRGLTIEQLLKASDEAMYEVKQIRRQSGRPRGAKPEVWTSSTPAPI